MSTELSNLTDRVNAALDNIRPFLNDDGGDVKLIEITEDNTVNLELLGSCSTCSMSGRTLKSGIEESIRKAAPEINKVVAINTSN